MTVAFRSPWIVSAGFLLTACTLHATPTSGLFTPQITAPASQAQITFSEDGLPSGQNWAVVIHPSSEVSGFRVTAGYVRQMDSTRPGRSAPDQSGKLSADYYSISDSQFAFQRLSGLDESVFVIADVPAGKAISVVEDGRTVFHGSLTATTLLVDGNLVGDTSVADERAALMLMVPQMIAEEFGPELRQTDSGGWTASTAALRRHLESFPLTSRIFPGQQFYDADGKAAMVSAQVQINPAGAVTSVQIEHGSGPVADAVFAALRGAKFKPFIQNGMAIAVTGNIQISLWKDGQPLQSNIGGV